MLVEFNLYGKNIIFDEDLKEYCKLKEYFASKQEDCIRENGHLMCDKDDVYRLYESTNSYLEDLAKELIKKLSKYNVYNITIDDFLYTNKGYENIIKGITAYDNVRNELLNKRDNLTESELANARKRAESQITGLDFSVISNSFMAHALYLQQEKSALKKQAQKAQEQYDRESKSIVNELNKATEDTLENLYNNTFIPNFKKSLEQCFSILFDTYLNELYSISIINKNCTKGIDYDRSNSMLKNIDVVDSKEKLLAEIIQICPYNLSVYYYAYISDLFTDDLIEIAKYFNISSKIVSDFIDRDMYVKCNNSLEVKKYCDSNEKLFELFAKLNNMNVLCFRKKYSDEVVNRILDHLKNFRLYMESQDKFNEDIEKSFGDDPIEEEIYPYLIKSDLIDSDGLKCLIIDCDHQELFKKITNIFCTEINTYEELVKIIKELIDQNLKLYFQYKAEKQEQNRIILEKKAEEERVALKKKAKNKELIKKATIVFATIVFAFVIFGICNIVNKNRIYTKAMNCVESNKDLDALKYFSKIESFSDTKERIEEIVDRNVFEKEKVSIYDAMDYLIYSKDNKELFEYP